MDQREARCGCGALSVRCLGEPTFVALCHCLDCQRRTGSIFGITAFFPEQDVEITGASRSWTRSSDNGTSVRFHFCPECGSNLFWYPERKPGMVAVAAGNFADPNFPAPSVSVYEHHRHPWAELALRF